MKKKDGVSRFDTPSMNRVCTNSVPTPYQLRILFRIGTLVVVHNTALHIGHNEVPGSNSAGDSVDPGVCRGAEVADGGTTSVSGGVSGGHYRDVSPLGVKGKLFCGAIGDVLLSN